MEKEANEALQRVIYLKDFTDISECLKDEKNKNVANDDTFGEEKIYYELEKISDKVYGNDGSNFFILDKNGLRDKENVEIVRNFGGKKMMGPYVGFLRSRIENHDCTFIITSRFDSDKNLFTNYILNKAFSMKSIIFPSMNVPLEQNHTMEMLMAIVFIRQMGKAYKKGLFRQYRTYENNDMKVKGKIDISRHIKQNPLFNGRLAYSYREYTADNDINRIILTAYEMISKKISG